MSRVTRYVSSNLIYCPWLNSLNNHFTDLAMASKLAENNANDLNKGLNLTSLGFVMWFAND